jgi:hypothetical protein
MFYVKNGAQFKMGRDSYLIAAVSMLAVEPTHTHNQWTLGALWTGKKVARKFPTVTSAPSCVFMTRA